MEFKNSVEENGGIILNMFKHFNFNTYRICPLFPDFFPADPDRARVGLPGSNGRFHSRIGHDGPVALGSCVAKYSECPWHGRELYSFA